MHSDPMQGHPGTSKMLNELRKRIYFPNLAQRVQEFIDNCQMCIRTKPVPRSKITPPLQQIYDPCNGPEDILEIDLVGELPSSNGYTHVLTACDYFTKYLFAIPIRRPDTQSVVSALMQIFTQHAYIPRHLLTDKGSAFTSQVLRDIMTQSGIKIDHATIKHAQTIGMIERNHQKLKNVLKINVAADSPQWDRYVNIAIMAHNTTYHQTIKCTPSELFHGRVPYNALDFKYGNPLQPPRNNVNIKTLIDEVNQKFKTTHDNIIEAFHKYKQYYDRKAQALPLKVGEFAFLLNPKYTNQSDKVAFNSFQWDGPYRIVKCLTNSNYIIRKVGTQRTQCVHRMRLRSFKPHEEIADIEAKKQEFYPDPEAVEDAQIFNENIPSTVADDAQGVRPQHDSTDECESETGVVVVDTIPITRTNAPLRESEPHHTRRVEPTPTPPHPQPEIQQQQDESLPLVPHQQSDRPIEPPTRTTATRYGLRSNPTPRTYSDFLAHELSLKPVARRFSTQ